MEHCNQQVCWDNYTYSDEDDYSDNDDYSDDDGYYDNDYYDDDDDSYDTDWWLLLSLVITIMMNTGNIVSYFGWQTCFNIHTTEICVLSVVWESIYTCT